MIEHLKYPTLFCFTIILFIRNGIIYKTISTRGLICAEHKQKMQWCFSETLYDCPNVTLVSK